MLRIDADPEDMQDLESEAPPERSIKKLGVVTLTIVDGKSQVRGTWTGLDQMGNQVEWQSVTITWRVDDGS